MPPARQLVAAIVLCAAAAHADELASSAAAEAIAWCEAANDVPVAERTSLLSRGLRRAEEAVEMDRANAAAHFAVFCNLGKRAQLRREAIGLPGLVLDLARARRELDVALELSPRYADALAAKGEMLVELPRVFGGDRVEGERLLRLAVELAPDDARMRLLLAKALEADGRRDEALPHATAAVELLERAGRERELAVARSLVGDLR